MAGEIKDRGMPRRVLDLVMLSVLPILMSCGRVVFHEFTALDGGRWSNTDTLTFVYDGSLDKEETAGYEMSVEVRTDASYPYKMLSVRVESIDMRTEGIMSVDTLHCAVYDAQGRRIGATAGMLYQVSSEPLFVEKGCGDSIMFRLTHAMYSDELVGVSDVGLRLCASSGHGRRLSSGT